jgi:hypothetical protein
LPTCSNKMESLLPSCTWYNNNIHINNHWSNMIYVCAGSDVNAYAWQAEGQEAGPPFNTAVVE